MECRRPRSEASCDQDEVRRSRVRHDRSGRPRCASSLRKGTSGLALAGQSRHVSKVLPCVDTSRYAHRVSPMSCRAEITSLLAESSGDRVSRGLGFGSLRDVSVPGRAFVHFRKTPYLSRPLQDSRCTNARPGTVTDVCVARAARPHHRGRQTYVQTSAEAESLCGRTFVDRAGL